MALRLAVIATLLVALTGCGPYPGSGSQGLAASSGRPAPSPPRPVFQFPTEAELAQIVAQAPPPVVDADGSTRAPVAVERWDLTATPAQGDPAYVGEGPIERVVSQIAEQHGVSLRRSASLRCAAEEMARFQLQNEGPQTQRLGRHLLMACGSAAQNAGTFSVAYSSRRSASDIAAEIGSRMRRSIADGLAQGSWIGVAEVRDGGSAVLVMAFAEPALELEPWGSPGGDGYVRVAGTVRRQVGDVVALATRGGGVVACAAEPGIAEPRFAFRCPLDAGAPSAHVELLADRAGTLERRVVGQLVITRDAETKVPFASPGAGTAGGVGEGAEAILAQVNARRAEAGLSPLRLSTEESERHAAYASALFGLSRVGGGDGALDRLVLGMMAGWRVNAGAIRDAGNVWMQEHGTADAAPLVQNLLDTPSGRSALMEPDARILAVGVTQGTAPEHVGVVLTTYQLYDGVDHRRDAAQLMARLTELRRRRGLPPPEPLPASAVQKQGPAVAQNQVWPEVALQKALDEDSARLRTPLRGTVIETYDPTQMPFPPEALTAPRLAVTLDVTHTKPSGAPWAQYVVFLVMR